MKHFRLFVDIISLHSIQTILINRNETISVIENNSTGGLFQAMLALTERSDEFYRGGIVINKYDKKIQLIPMKAAHIEDNNISALADKFSVHVAGKFNSDWGLAIIGEDITGQKLSRKSWLTIQYKNNIVLSTSVTQPRQGLRTPDVIVQKAIIHFLKSIVI